MSNTEITRHQLDAALRAARLIDETGNTTEDSSSAYIHAVTLGEHPSDALFEAESLLVRSGLLSKSDGRLVPEPALADLARLDDGEALIALAVLVGYEATDARLLVEGRTRKQGHNQQVSDPLIRQLVGSAGEVYVAGYCRDELIKLGRPDLADRVKRVSLVSDLLGYDVLAATVSGPPRLLEVKTQSGQPSDTFNFYLSRNEFDVGCQQQSWALVGCTAPDGPNGAISIVGWCRASALRPYLPTDGNGKWTEARVRLPVSALFNGLPDAV